MTCSCHSGYLYAGLVGCPACGHGSLDALQDWAGCERRKCGYETTDPDVLISLRLKSEQEAPCDTSSSTRT